MHGSTFGANPVSCSGALVVVDKVGDPDFLEQVEQKGEYLREKLKQTDLPITAIRGEGLMIGIDLEGIDAKELVTKCLENGLVTLTAKTALRLLPPLIITKDEIDAGVAILVKSVKELKEEAK